MRLTGQVWHHQRTARAATAARSSDFQDTFLQLLTGVTGHEAAQHARRPDVRARPGGGSPTKRSAECKGETDMASIKPMRL